MRAIEGLNLARNLKANGGRLLTKNYASVKAKSLRTEGGTSTEGPYAITKFTRRRCSSGEKGPAARRRPKAAREAYFLYVDRADEGANEADGPFSSR